MDHAQLFRGLGHKLLCVLKAILLEAKVMIYSPSAEACSRAVLCLLSLFPGGLWLSFNSDGFGTRHFTFRNWVVDKHFPKNRKSSCFSSNGELQSRQDNNLHRFSGRIEWNGSRSCSSSIYRLYKKITCLEIAYSPVNFFGPKKAS